MTPKCHIADFDGTLIHEDLEREFMKWLLRQKEIRYRMLFVSLFTLPINMLRNKLGYPSIFKSWTYVLRGHIEEYINAFIQNEAAKTIHMREDVWQMLSGGDEIVLLSGCYKDLLIAYLEYIKRKSVFTEIIGCEMEANQVRVKIHPYGRSKCQFVNQGKYNIGVANERVDHFYMDMCNEQIYV